MKHYNGWQGWGLHGLSIELISYNNTTHENDDDNDDDNERFKSHIKKGYYFNLICKIQTFTIKNFLFLRIIQVKVKIFLN